MISTFSNLVHVSLGWVVFFFLVNYVGRYQFIYLTFYTSAVASPCWNGYPHSKFYFDIRIFFPFFSLGFPSWFWICVNFQGKLLKYVV